MSDEAGISQNGLGLLGLLEQIQAQKSKHRQDGKRIFDLVMEEGADAQALEGVVYQESLLQLIFYVLDHRKLVTSRVNQGKSAEQRTAAASADRAKVSDWCDANPEIAWMPLKSAIDEAMAATSISASTSVRDYIRAWRKSNPKS
jgi:hypothetical protein